MQVGVIYDVVDRQHPAIQVGYFHNGRFFNAVKSPPFHDGDIAGNELRSRSGEGGIVLGTIEGLVMSRNGGGRVFDLIPRK